MLINSNDIKTTKKQIEVMQAFIDGKEIEYERINRTNVSEIWKDCTKPIWDFEKFIYRIKLSDKKNCKKFTNPLHSHSDSFFENSEPIKKTHNVPYFHSIMADQFVELGIELPDYMVKQLSPEKLDYLKKKAKRLREETGYPKFEESILEDTVNESLEPEDVNTEELFEVIYYCEIMKEFEFVKQLYKNEDLENKKHLQKTGRSFIVDKDTNQIIKVNK